MKKIIFILMLCFLSQEIISAEREEKPTVSDLIVEQIDAELNDTPLETIYRNLSAKKKRDELLPLLLNQYRKKFLQDKRFDWKRIRPGTDQLPVVFNGRFLVLYDPRGSLRALVLYIIDLETGRRMQREVLFPDGIGHVVQAGFIDKHRLFLVSHDVRGTYNNILHILTITPPPTFAYCPSVTTGLEIPPVNYLTPIMVRGDDIIFEVANKRNADAPTLQDDKTWILDFNWQDPASSQLDVIMSPMHIRHLEADDYMQVPLYGQSDPLSAGMNFFHFSWWRVHMPLINGALQPTTITSKHEQEGMVENKNNVIQDVLPLGKSHVFVVVPYRSQRYEENKISDYVNFFFEGELRPFVFSIGKNEQPVYDYDQRAEAIVLLHKEVEPERIDQGYVVKQQLTLIDRRKLRHTTAVPGIGKDVKLFFIDNRVVIAYLYQQDQIDYLQWYEFKNNSFITLNEPIKLNIISELMKGGDKLLAINKVEDQLIVFDARAASMKNATIQELINYDRQTRPHLYGGEKPFETQEYFASDVFSQ